MSCCHFTFSMSLVELSILLLETLPTFPVSVCHWHHLLVGRDGPSLLLWWSQGQGLWTSHLGDKGRELILGLKECEYCWGEAQDTSAVKYSLFSRPGLASLGPVLFSPFGPFWLFPFEPMSCPGCCPCHPPLSLSCLPRILHRVSVFSAWEF